MRRVMHHCIWGCLWLLGVTCAQAATSTSFLHNFKSIALQDQSGKPFTVGQLANQVVLFSFIFTGCDSTCPIQTRVLSQVLQDLPAQAREQVRFVSVSIDPGNDTPEKMLKFARQMQADQDGWLFLTGDVLQLQDLARRLHLMDETSPNTPAIHRTSLWLVDKQGRMLQRYRGDPPDRERLVRELIQVSLMPLSDS
ncbi:MAG: hypothetical protein CMK89_12090 [Pseudomonadales bacterium]|nr:hypothetical protein [Pseudomonadales bacterium]